MAESKEELKSLLMRVKENTEKASLKLNIQKTKIMASISWQRDGGKVETVTDFIYLGSKITVDGDCSHEITSGQGTVGCSGRRLKQAEPEQRAEGCSQGKSSNTLGLSTDLPAPLPSPPQPQGLINSTLPGHQELLSLLALNTDITCPPCVFQSLVSGKGSLLLSKARPLFSRSGFHF